MIKPITVWIDLERQIKSRRKFQPYFLPVWNAKLDARFVISKIRNTNCCIPVQDIYLIMDTHTIIEKEIKTYQ